MAASPKAPPRLRIRLNSPTLIGRNIEEPKSRIRPWPDRDASQGWPVPLRPAVLKLQSAADGGGHHRHGGGHRTLRCLGQGDQPLDRTPDTGKETNKYMWPGFQAALGAEWSDTPFGYCKVDSAAISAATGTRHEGIYKTVVRAVFAAHCPIAVSRRRLPANPRLRPSLLVGKTGAGEGIRTLDPNLGKVVLYP